MSDQKLVNEVRAYRNLLNSEAYRRAGAMMDIIRMGNVMHAEEIADHILPPHVPRLGVQAPLYEHYRPARLKDYFTAGYGQTDIEKLAISLDEQFGILAARAIGAEFIDYSDVSVRNPDTLSVMLPPPLHNPQQERFLILRKPEYNLDDMRVAEAIASQYNFCARDQHLPIMDGRFEMFAAQQEPFLREFSDAMIESMDIFIGKEDVFIEVDGSETVIQREQGANKAHHSRSVGLLVSLAMAEVCKRAGVHMSKIEKRSLYYSGTIHDGGRITNIDLMDKRFEALGNRSAREIVKPAAAQIYEEHFRETGVSKVELEEAICAAAISDRCGPLFKAANKINPEVGKLIRGHFKGNKVHNPGELSMGIFSHISNMYAHHDRLDTRDTHAFSEHAALDKVYMIADWIDGGMGDARTLDEAVACVVFYARFGEIPADYARMFLEGYGTGESVIEKWWDLSIERKHCRILPPEGRSQPQKELPSEVVVDFIDEYLKKAEDEWVDLRNPEELAEFNGKFGDYFGYDHHLIQIFAWTSFGKNYDMIIEMKNDLGTGRFKTLGDYIRFKIDDFCVEGQQTKVASSLQLLTSSDLYDMKAGLVISKNHDPAALQRIDSAIKQAEAGMTIREPFPKLTAEKIRADLKITHIRNPVSRMMVTRQWQPAQQNNVGKNFTDAASIPDARLPVRQVSVTMAVA